MWRRLGDAAALAEAYRTAAPFPHFVIDDFVEAADLPRLLEILDEEPVETRAADIYLFDASAPEPKTVGLLQMREDFAKALAPPLGRITGQAVSRVDMRAYAYRPGHYLLPHSDHQTGMGRKLAYVYYVPSPEPPEGGELELFAGFESAKLVAPRGNRLIVFEVSDASLHQVREVMSGLRISLAGWFYA